MREIKFRAWDKVRKEYLSAGAVLIQVGCGNRPTHSDIHLDGYGGISNGRFELQQFTGLTDKNGVEVYEGDYLQSNLGNGEEYNIGVAEWFGPWQGWCVMDNGSPSAFGGKDSVTADYYCDDLLVVGNTHQGYQS